MKQEMETTPSIPVKEREVLDITDGHWILEDAGLMSRVNITSTNGFEHIAAITIAGYGVKAKDNAKAICTAVNQTYGKGYNPVAMEELYKALERIIDRIKENEFQGNFPSAFERAETALQNAKTIKP